MYLFDKKKKIARVLQLVFLLDSGGNIIRKPLALQFLAEWSNMNIVRRYMSATIFVKYFTELLLGDLMYKKWKYWQQLLYLDLWISFPNTDSRAEKELCLVNILTYCLTFEDMCAGNWVNNAIDQKTWKHVEHVWTHFGILFDVWTH